jgi:hypothetical protein
MLRSTVSPSRIIACSTGSLLSASTVFSS